MGRHGMKYCLICNPFGNGSSGDDGTEAIGKYYVENIPGVDQHTTGWHGVCEGCARMVQRQGHRVEPLPGHEDHEFFQDDDTEEDVVHECTDPDWRKQSLVTEDGGYDIVQCQDCGIYAKRHGLGQRYKLIGYEQP